jgi:hypothetical protein
MEERKSRLSPDYTHCRYDLRAFTEIFFARLATTIPTGSHLSRRDFTERGLWRWTRFPHRLFVKLPVTL